MTDPSTNIGTHDRQLLREYLALTREQQRAPATLKRLRRSGWSVESIASLAQMSIAEATEILREGTR